MTRAKQTGVSPSSDAYIALTEEQEAFLRPFDTISGVAEKGFSAWRRVTQFEIAGLVVLDIDARRYHITPKGRLSLMMR